MGLPDSPHLRESRENAWVHFRSLAQAYSALGKLAGVDICPYRNPRLPLFQSISPAAQRAAIESLRASVDVCRQTLASGGTLNDSGTLIWNALRHFRLRPPSTLFACLEPDTVIEIHSQEGIQIFRNFAFYRFCNYSLEELHSSSYADLFERDNPKILDSILAFAGDVYGGRLREPRPFHIPRHRVRETRSPFPSEIELEMHLGAPLFGVDSGAPEATLVMESASLVAELGGYPVKQLELG